ncbi:MFS transporter [Methanolobus halotolerans]|uniref:MFS transporter n=1 Tax=Methanolobus halotolerans TaxID=2052935 RepID=A0A4E0PVN8_9EURY|nr:MFS transporter [Methanolobus halotolerans]
MYRTRLLLYLTVFVIMALSNAVVPVLPEIAASEKESSGTLAWIMLFSGYFIGALLTMLPFGFLSDRYERLHFVVLAILLTLISGSILLITENLYILIIVRLVEGTACGAFFPVAYALLSEYKEKKRYISEFNFLLNAGLAIGVAFAGYLAQWHIKSGILLFTVIAGLAFVAGIWILKRHEPVKEVRAGNSASPSERGMIAGSFTNRSYLNIWIITFLLFGLTGVITSFYPEHSSGLLSKTEIGISLAALYVSAMATNILAGRLNLSYNYMIIIGVLITVIGTLVFIQQPIMGLILIGTGSGMGMIGLPMAVSQMNIERGLGMGIFNTYVYAGLGLMPIFTGAFIEIMEFEIIFASTALILLVPVLINRQIN